MTKDIFQIVLSLILFYCVSYSGHRYWITEKIGKKLGWLVLVWIGLFIFLYINK